LWRSFKDYGYIFFCQDFIRSPLADSTVESPDIDVFDVHRQVLQGSFGLDLPVLDKLSLAGRPDGSAIDQVPFFHQPVTLSCEQFGNPAGAAPWPPSNSHNRQIPGLTGW